MHLRAWLVALALELVWAQQPCETDADCRYPACLAYEGYPYVVGCEMTEINGLGGAVSFKICKLLGVGLPCPIRGCMAGEYRTPRISSSLENPCAKCAVGTYYPDPEPPVPGSILAINGYPSYACAACGIHQYQNSTGRAACETCESGTYQFSTGQTSCLPCPARACPAGQYLASSVCREACRPCSTCPTGQTTVKTCTRNSDTVCGSVGRCAGANTSSLQGYEWITEACRKGEYLWGLGPPPEYAQICQRCPVGMAGLNGVYCERCGPLQRPYHLDQASCVCADTAVMNASGACVCPSGYTLGAGGACARCGLNTYSANGTCYACRAGAISAQGATSCVACTPGTYRLPNQAGCTGCGSGWYAPDATVQGCRQCNSSCPAGMKGESCPGNTDSAYLVCAACDVGLPGNASWTVGCAYDCRAGFYRVPGGCEACTVDKACPAGFTASECGPDADANCDTACVNASKPDFYSEWLVGRGCPWGCKGGYGLVATDYWLFKLFECVAGA